MLKIIHADFYRTFHRPYLYVLTGILCIFALFFNLIFPPDTQLVGSLAVTLKLLSVLPLLSVMFVAIIMAEEIEYGTLKNTISLGAGRNSVFIGKSISSVAVMLISAAVTFAVYFGSAYMRFQRGKGYSPTFLKGYLLRIGAAVLLVVGTIFIAMLFAVLFRKSITYAFVFTGFVLIPPLIFQSMSFTKDTVAYVCNFLYMSSILGQESLLEKIPLSELWMPVLVTAVHILIFGIIGLEIFRRQEIR